MTTADTSFTATGPADNGFQTNGNFSFGATMVNDPFFARSTVIDENLILLF
jgi:hypothetical protein